MIKTDGPCVTIDRSCHDCKHCVGEYERVQNDSGFKVFCSHDSFPQKKYIGWDKWSTPDWCPYPMPRLLAHDVLLAFVAVSREVLNAMGANQKPYKDAKGNDRYYLTRLQYFPAEIWNKLAAVMLPKTCDHAGYPVATDGTCLLCHSTCICVGHEHVGDGVHCLRGVRENDPASFCPCGWAKETK